MSATTGPDARPDADQSAITPVDGGMLFSFREVEDSREVKDLRDLLDQLYVRAHVPLKGLEQSFWVAVRLTPPLSCWTFQGFSW